MFAVDKSLWDRIKVCKDLFGHKEILDEIGGSE
jgi:hypothetical protein